MTVSAGQGRGAGGAPAALILALAAGLVGYLVATRWLGDDRGPVERTFQVMNTQARLVIPSGTGQASASRLADMAEAAIRDVDRLMGPFGEESDIRRLNDAKAGEWVEVSPLTWTVVMDALRWHRLSDGAFDPTIGPLKRLFTFDGQELTEWPDEKTLEDARAMVGADNLLFEREGMRLSWKRSGMRLDLGAIAKGFSADQAVDVLLREGVRSALVEVGGEIRTIGMKAGDRPWRTGVRDPRGERVLSISEMADGAVATSGDYESYFMFKGKRYQHIIDPRAGSPITGGAASVTVRHPDSCMAADALATTLVVLGPEEGGRFLKDQALGLFVDGVEAEMYMADAESVVRKYVFTVDGDGGYSIREEAVGAAAEVPADE
ncbi:MAG: FAD:protein FMN transferase [Planctomycetota bacterium]|jgi:thiamine biosynthesis lipoprotein|nr:FAD:protein FMN transferase [Planctomycetota bacterium]